MINDDDPENFSITNRSRGFSPITIRELPSAFGCEMVIWFCMAPVSALKSAA